ncbi:hypothetical protein BTO05_07055 [Winogradskyella sp. PC-19]|nr:hypothetical protein BTO05_07055 [Winogradskyella sp. PC-19]
MEQNNINYGTLIGGNTRFYIKLFLFYIKVIGKKPRKADYLNEPNKEKHYLKYTDFHFRNSIATIITLFIFLSAFFKFLKILF